MQRATQLISYAFPASFRWLRFSLIAFAARRLEPILRTLLLIGLSALALLSSTAAFALTATSTRVSSDNYFPYQNQAVTLTAVVLGNSPTGTVTFRGAGGTVYGTSALSSGQATLGVRFPDAGNNPVWATYSGDANNSPATLNEATALILEVQAQSVTTTSFQWLGSSVAVGQSTSFSINVTGRSTSGREQQTGASFSLLESGIFATGIAVGPGVNSGTITTSFNTAGKHYVAGQFEETIESTRSISSSIIVDVQKRVPSVALTSSPASVLQGQPLTLTAAVTGTSPTGSVTFKDGGTTLGSASLNASGVATLQVVLNETGAHSLTANYSGDANHFAASSSLNQGVTPKATTTTGLATNSTPAVAGDSVALTATVTGDNPGGMVTFIAGGSSLGTAALSSGTARLQPVFAHAGDYSLTASYGGDAFNQASNSSAVAITIGKHSTVTKLSVDPKPQFQGQPIKLVAQVTGANPTGQVVFSNGGKILGNAALASGQATLSTALPDMGPFSLSATYAGDADNLASASSSQAADGTQGTAHVALAVSPTPVVNYEYDAEGNATKAIVAPASRALATKTDYDALGRPEIGTNAMQGTVKYGFDLLNQLTTITDPRQLVTQYQPTGLGDVNQLTSPDTGTATSTFDAAGNLKTRTDARGVLATYSYDELNRPAQVVYTKSGMVTRKLIWTYDQTGASFGYGVGRLTTASTPEVSTTFRYDAFGRVTMTVQSAATQRGAVGVPIVVNYGYDAAGNVNSLTYPSGRVVNFGWTDGQPQSISITSGGVTTNLLDQVVMSSFGPVQSWVWKLGATPKAHERVYDNNGRLVRHPLGVLLRDITYDDADRVSRFTHYDAATEAPAPAYDQTFSYDDLNRLYDVAGSGTSWSYRYDANGNRTTSSSGSTARAYTVQAASNRIDALSNPARNMLYDGAGNTSSDTQSGSSANFTSAYNLEGRWDTLNQSSKVGLVLYYDTLGRRVVRRALPTSGGICLPSSGGAMDCSLMVNTLYAYDASQHLLGEYKADGTLITEYVWLGDTPVAVIKPDSAAPGGVQVYAIHTDHLDTPRVILDAQGQVRWRWLGEPFGASPAEEQPTVGLAALQQNLRFPGQQYEPLGGRHYNHFRDYDPSTGRYVQSDPIGLNGGINTYGYANGNPLRFSDPFGLWGMDDVYGAVYDWTGGWEPSQGLVDFSAGWGDMLSFGITSQVRDGFGIGSVNKCSAFYKGGEAFGFVNGLALGWAQGTKAAAKAASGNNWANFSHSLFPKRFLKQFDNQAATWMNKVGNRMNGDFVTPALHTRMDAAAQFGLSREWLAANPLFSPFRQLINRVPYVPGAAAYGAGSAAMNSCSCEN